MNIKRIIWGAFGYVYMLGTVFIKALLIPIAALIILDIIFAGQSERKSTGALVGLSVFIHTIIAITTHRIILWFFEDSCGGRADSRIFRRNHRIRDIINI